ncbi:hypothetical protein MLD38_021011 [Melastoma candidum]|uniref:Uncharacterized protein n=1 Tax=Melastoma candidum TaxID=119954 RepID=A0ACB9QE19_9MYRT|nr:hypothetical protein MLD38_021011 [Melastoma candidum]
MTDSTTSTSIGKMISQPTPPGGVQVAPQARVPQPPPPAEDKPSKVEVWGWKLYGWCTYLIEMTLIPVVFPLIISQVVGPPPVPPPTAGARATAASHVTPASSDC